LRIGKRLAFSRRKTMSEIRRALTAEEWVGEDGYARYDMGYGIVMMDDGGATTIELGDDAGFCLVGGHRHALAALCLHEQSFGFTREDVDHLRAMARSTVTHGHGDYGPPDQYNPWITSLADRIEALLPPEDEG
jgi:hypothetical protein